MDRNRNNAWSFIGIVLVIMLLAAIFVGVLIRGNHGVGTGEVKGEDATVEKLLSKLSVGENTPQKGSVDLDDSNLYDELPEIEKYPLSVKGSADVVVEIFASPEKAGDGADSWLIDVAEQFNKKGKMVGGKTVAVSVRNVSSGLAADYIISNKYKPDMYSPSSELWGSYVDVEGGSLELYNKSLVGNTAGFLISKNSGLKNFADVVEAVQNNEINLGYTNPQASTAGLNLLVSILSTYGDGDLTGESAVNAFSEFQKNIPYVAYNTIQMRDSSAGGKLDGMIMEYQSYINDKELSRSFDFVPFGVRHDNPLYVVDRDQKSANQLAAIKAFNEFCMSGECQTLAGKKGFNANTDYKSGIKVSGKDIKAALNIYKKEKDSGKEIIAVFVADVSGSMDGEPINRLKESLTNGAKYINDNNYIGLVSYHSSVTIELPIGQFDLNQRAYFQGAVDSLSAGGGTASYDAVIVALDMIQKEKENHPNAKTMLFLLSDGMANEGYSLTNIRGVLQSEGVPVYTISYTDEADTEALQELSEVNEAASINADSDDIIYKIKSLFNSQM